ncbi:ATP-binding protein [Streptomyces sp. NPDC007355]|uniref:ATP-binding protein n=1 Tax=Streptomyces sp. NPDC007355 TaxID=3364778 RepID=UPI00368565CA
MTTTTLSPADQQPSVLRAVATGERVFGLPLEHGPLAPATARHTAQSVLESWGLDDEQVYDVLLVISELVTNAVVYALPPVVLHLHLHAATDDTGSVQVHVSDGGPRPAANAGGWAAQRPEDEHGRGEAIITTLADHTGTGTALGSDTDGLIDH